MFTFMFMRMFYVYAHVDVYVYVYAYVLKETFADRSGALQPVGLADDDALPTYTFTITFADFLL